VATSREARADRVHDHYMTLLGRAPGAAAAGWVSVTARPDETVTAGITGSAEYRARSIARF
jgi:hypothetical protein